MMKKHRNTWALVAAAVIALPSVAMAVGYASGISKTGDTVSFILNQDADNVSVVLDGGASTLDLGALAKGTRSFDMTGYSSFQIQVSTSEPVGWTQISTDDTLTSFYAPLGVSVNKHPWSPNFGKVYVSETRTATTGFGRSLTSGIYMLNADASDAGFADGGRDWAAAGNSAPKKSTIGPDDHFYVCDLSNDLAFQFSADMASLTQLIDASNRTADQYVESIHVEGTQAGGDRQIFLVNSNYNDTDRKGLIQYDLGGNAAAATDDTGTQYIGPDYFGFYPRDVARDSNGDWYMNQFRWDPAQAPALAKFLDGAPPTNTAEWETPQTDPYNGAYGIALFEEKNWVAYGNYYSGMVEIFDMTDGSHVGSFDAGSRVRELDFDVAGNVYTVDNSVEWLRIWSPGGDWVATTGSDGSFTLIPEPTTLLLLAGGVLWLRRRTR